MINFAYTFNQLFTILPEFIAAVVISLLATPVVSKVAIKFHALDKKFKERMRLLKKVDFKDALPKLGGLAIYVSFIICLFLFLGFTTLTFGIGLGATVLAIYGFLDDVYDLPGWAQFLFQFLAVAIVVLSGVRIEGINSFTAYIDLQNFTQTFEILGLALTFVWPADLVTIIWFMVIINAMNWVAGIDALEETMSAVAGFTLLLLAIKFGLQDMMVLSAIFTGATLGFWIFNLPPAKILGGTIANTLLGFMLGVLAIEIDGKFTTAILLLAIPVVDFVWVLTWRLIKFREFNPLKLMQISGHHHLHHRLMALGLSNKETLGVEILFFSFFAVAAYYFAGFDIVAVGGLASFVIVLTVFAGIAIYGNIRERREAQKTVKKVEEEEKEEEVYNEPERPPEDVYAY